MKIVGTAIGIALFLVAGAFLWHAAAQRPGPMEREDFARTVRALASYAKETKLFVEQLQDGQLTASFTRTHREKLEENVSDESKKLEAPLPADLSARGEKVRALAADLDASLKLIQQAVADGVAMRKIQDEVKRIGDELQRLEPAS
jgi:DNA polymerase III sliding clamp (beta) subunit (PCNA family)